MHSNSSAIGEPDIQPTPQSVPYNPTSPTPATTPPVKPVDQRLVNRLAGRILLQVQGKGEAWYVDGKTGKRFYLKDGRTAFEALRRFGVGVTNANLAKVPVAGSNERGDQRFINGVKGKILLQVQSHGEAWYVNPVDGKRHYLKDGNAAFQVMRQLSLGATNDTLAKIQVGE